MRSDSGPTPWMTDNLGLMADLTFTSQTPFIFQVDGEVNSASEVVVDLRPATLAGEGGALLASENLDDVADPDAARASLGAVDASLSEAAGVSVALGNYADDAAAAVGGVAVGALYRTGSILKVRVA